MNNKTHQSIWTPGTIIGLLIFILVIGTFIVAATGAFGVYKGAKFEQPSSEDYRSDRDPNTNPYTN